MSTPFLLDERNRPFAQGMADRPPPMTGLQGVALMPALFIPFVLAGMFFLALTFSSWATLVKFTIDARPTTALVTGKEIDNSGDSTEYYVVYHYSTPEDRTFNGRATVDRSRFDELAIGGQVAIEYLGGDQGRSQIAGENHLWMPLFMTVFSLFWNGFILLVGYLVIGRLIKEYWLRARGQLVPAEILSYRAEPDSDGDLSVTIEYRVVSPDGRPVSGRYDNFRNDLKGKPAPTCPASAAALYIDEQTHMLL